MKKLAFKDYTPRANGKRSVEEAIAEIQREMDVRKRLFDRWVADGKMSWMDAHDRMERHLSALHHLIQYNKQLDMQSQEPLTETIEEVQPPSFICLDDQPQAASA